jgi:hypothetical protein
MYTALDRTACAPFIKERRMKFREPTKLHRKSGMWGTHSIFIATIFSVERCGVQGSLCGGSSLERLSTDGGCLLDVMIRLFFEGRR